MEQESPSMDGASDMKAELLGLLEEAHYNAAIRNKGNISATAAMVVYQGSLDPIKAVAAGLLSIGGTHAPVVAARELISNWRRDEVTTRRIVTNMIAAGQKIPGFGNSYYKEGVDPSFQEAYDKYREYAGEDNPIRNIERFLNNHLQAQNGFQGHLYPNAAIITSGICDFLKMQPLYEIYSFIAGRSQAWLQLILNPVLYNSERQE